MSRNALASALKGISLHHIGDNMLHELDRGSSVQIAIVSADAIALMSVVAIWKR